ncbi:MULTISPECIES: cupin domain-containing protein [unclassified Pseudomonas]|uniref:cupin domain-containing protein n=1 Tax=unclassified Pseudomonas TaxID=196821 RepID=UPI00190E58CA|nr:MULTISPECIES: cupin domain-containing protein [unclassified Pseudomonas]
MLMSVGGSALAETAYVPFNFPDLANEAKEPIVLGPAGETIEFFQSGKTTCGRYLFAKVTVPPTVGPPPHVHHWTDEWFYAPNGGITLFMGTNQYPDLERPPGKDSPKDTLQLMTMRPKELFYGERYIVHGFVNPTDKPQELYIVWTPDTPDVSILPYFLKAGVIKDPKNPDQKPNPLSKIRLVSMAPAYGINQSTDFWEYVDKVVETEEHSHMPDNRERLMKLLTSQEKCQPDTQ